MRLFGVLLSLFLFVTACGATPQLYVGGYLERGFGFETYGFAAYENGFETEAGWSRQSSITELLGYDVTPYFFENGEGGEVTFSSSFGFDQYETAYVFDAAAAGDGALIVGSFLTLNGVHSPYVIYWNGENFIPVVGSPACRAGNFFGSFWGESTSQEDSISQDFSPRTEVKCLATSVYCTNSTNCFVAGPFNEVDSSDYDPDTDFIRGIVNYRFDEDTQTWSFYNNPKLSFNNGDDFGDACLPSYGSFKLLPISYDEDPDAWFIKDIMPCGSLATETQLEACSQCIINPRRGFISSSWYVLRGTVAVNQNGWESVFVDEGIIVDYAVDRAEGRGDVWVITSEDTVLRTIDNMKVETLPISLSSAQVHVELDCVSDDGDDCSENGQLTQFSAIEVDDAVFYVAVVEAFRGDGVTNGADDADFSAVYVWDEDENTLVRVGDPFSYIDLTIRLKLINGLIYILGYVQLANVQESFDDYYDSHAITKVGGAAVFSNGSWVSPIGGGAGENYISNLDCDDLRCYAVGDFETVHDINLHGLAFWDDGNAETTRPWFSAFSFPMIEKSVEKGENYEGFVYALLVDPENSPNVFVGGQFDWIGDSEFLGSIIYLSASTLDFITVGGGLWTLITDVVYCLDVSSAPCEGVVQGGQVRALTHWATGPLGADTYLFAAGYFSLNSNHEPLSHIAYVKLSDDLFAPDGAVWTDAFLDGGCNEEILDMVKWDDNLFVSGYFDKCGTQNTYYIAHLDLDNDFSLWHWRTLGLGVDDIPSSMTVFDNSYLIVGGYFEFSGGLLSQGFAAYTPDPPRWRRVIPRCTGDCKDVSPLTENQDQRLQGDDRPTICLSLLSNEGPSEFYGMCSGSSGLLYLWAFENPKEDKDKLLVKAKIRGTYSHEYYNDKPHAMSFINQTQLVTGWAYDCANGLGGYGCTLGNYDGQKSNFIFDGFVFEGDILVTASTEDNSAGFV
eukprot:CAMPEP_0174277782 /NCGR_PEP_ID=MMETSP0439-20130205/61115_1 /TAXON_ID=0 /ORGANISM="Stereomyxa ramosa, Strain Chinc5" /LENGTH=958 /DNA_ID=CAMNT_0015370131 /DNA_START=71 /DNA_END=2947 /DNA_ORIENTATION=+